MHLLICLQIRFFQYGENLRDPTWCYPMDLNLIFTFKHYVYIYFSYPCGANKCFNSDEAQH